MARQNWETIRDLLSAEIAEGRLNPGARLPTEPELCRDFEAGRHSVRRAVAALAADGKLRVEQGRGTFVQAAPLISYHIGKRTRWHENLLGQGLAPASEALAEAQVPADAGIAAALDIVPGAMVHRLTRRGLADGVPISIGISSHAVDRFPDLPGQLRSGLSLTEVYRAHGIADYFRKRTTLYARRPTAEEADLLTQHPDQPVIVMQKIDVDAAGRGIGRAESIWAGDRVQFSISEGDEQ